MESPPAGGERRPGGPTWLRGVGIAVAVLGALVQMFKPLPAVVDHGLVAAVEFLPGLGGLVAVLSLLRSRRSGTAVAVLGVLAILLDADGGGSRPRVIPGLVMVLGAVLADAGLRRSATTGDGALGLIVQLVGWLGVLAQLPVAFAFLAVGLAAPAWAVAVLFLLWGLLLAFTLHVRRTLPLLTPLVPVVTFGLLYGLLLTGGRLFHWMA